jgi:hypothetical protein
MLSLDWEKEVLLLSSFDSTRVAVSDSTMEERDVLEGNLERLTFELDTLLEEKD